MTCLLREQTTGITIMNSKKVNYRTNYSQINVHGYKMIEVPEGTNLGSIKPFGWKVLREVACF